MPELRFFRAGCALALSLMAAPLVVTDIPAGKNNLAPTILKALTQVVTPANVPQ